MDASTSQERNKREIQSLRAKTRENVPCCVRKEKRGSPQIQGLPGKKKGDRENLSPMYGGGALPEGKRTGNSDPRS